MQAAEGSSTVINERKLHVGLERSSNLRPVLQIGRKEVPVLGCESQGTRPPFPVEKVLVDMPSQPSVAVRCPEVEVTHTHTHTPNSQTSSFQEALCVFVPCCYDRALLSGNIFFFFYLGGHSCYCLTQDLSKPRELTGERKRQRGTHSTEVHKDTQNEFLLWHS